MFLWSSNSGSGWNPSSSSRAQNDGAYEVYGDYHYPSTAVVSTDTYYLHTFMVTADSGSPAVHSEVSGRALNEPVIP